MINRTTRGKRGAANRVVKRGALASWGTGNTKAEMPLKSSKKYPGGQQERISETGART